MPTPLSKAKFAMLRSLTRAKGRDEYGLFIAEGERIVRDAIARGHLPNLVVVCDEISPDNATVAGIEAEMPERIFSVTAKDFSEIADTVNSQGIAGVFEMRPNRPLDLRAQARTSLLILDNVRDPGNLGMMLRHAAAFDCDGVVMLEGCCDPYNPKAVRASMGGIFEIPFEKGASLGDIVTRLKDSSIALYACDKKDGAQSAFDVCNVDRAAFVIGGETEGVQVAWYEAGARALAIPQSSRVESLNAGVAASIVLALRYHAKTGV